MERQITAGDNAPPLALRVDASPHVASSPPAQLPLNERLTMLAGIAAISLLAWLYLLWMPMRPSDLGALPSHLLLRLPPGFASVLITFMMWAVMMVAMMLPGASQMILTYARIARSRAETPSLASWIFAGGYLVVWTAFSAAATAGQLILQQSSLLDGASRSTPIFGALLLTLAGLYQLTPLKNACLSHCRSPLGFFISEWQDGRSGALAMGLKHGAYCLGCCWFLMALLFVFGAMNLLWVAALSGLVLVEKIAPWNQMVARASGMLMLAGALALTIYR
jgi:predicted metal-binding membrane protein